MRKLSCSLIFLFGAFYSCDMFDWSAPSPDVALPPRVTSYGEAVTWIRGHVAPLKDEGDYWQTPEETMERRTGDCEDKNILFLAFAQLLSADPGTLELRIVRSDNGFHAIAYVGDTLYDATNTTTYNPRNVVRVIPWNEISVEIKRRNGGTYGQ